jgi:hypothetical protein
MMLLEDIHELHSDDLLTTSSFDLHCLVLGPLPCRQLSDFESFLNIGVWFKIDME